jgi:hypothetical protein
LLRCLSLLGIWNGFQATAFGHCLAGCVVSEDKSMAINVAVLTAAGAGILFLFKFLAGYFIGNLSIELSKDRLAAKEGKDHLVITVKLSKGDRSTIALHDVHLQIFSGADETNRVDDGIPLKGGRGLFVTNNRRVKMSFVGEEPARPALDFSGYDERTPVLRMTPGEVTQFDAIAEVPAAETVRIELAILGQTLLMRYITGSWPLSKIGRWLFKSRGVGQWRASVISLPLDKTKSPDKSS